MLVKMEKGLDAKDFLTVARTAHTLKSQAGNLGAKRLGILCGEIENLSRELEIPLTRIGRINQGEGLAVLDAAGKPIALEARGYDHFRT